MGSELILKVAAKRMIEIREEARAFFPDVIMDLVIDEEGRARIDVSNNGVPIGVEFIETDDSWYSPKRMMEYRRVLIGRMRLVVMVPRSHAKKARMKMLELNNWWLCYYMVFAYDGKGDMERVEGPVFTFGDIAYV